MASLIEAFSGEYGRIASQIIAEGQADPQALASYRDRFIYLAVLRLKLLLCRALRVASLIRVLI
jgi:hypothetical protein